MSTVSGVRERVEALEPGEFLHSRQIEGSRAAIDTAMSRVLTERNDIVRVAKGLYWKGVSSRFGPGKPSRLEAAIEFAGPGAGPSGWSALSRLGLTTQVPSEPEVAVPGRQARLPGARAIKRANINRVSLTAEEVAVLELLRDGWFERAGSELGGRVHELHERHTIDLQKIVAVAKTERPRVIAERAIRLTAA